MPRRPWLAAAMLATGALLVVSTQLAGAAPDRRGGIFKVGVAGASAKIDPQVAYRTTWWMLDATAANLYTFRPGGKLVPEVASRYTVSQDGTRYTFFLRKGFRFSDGEPVKATHFQYAIDRLTNRRLGSWGAPYAANIRSVHVPIDWRRLIVDGSRLIVDLNRPDERFIATLTLPFFQATSTELPLEREVTAVRSMAELPSAGPYAFTFNEVDRITQLRRNPFWTRGPGRTAPRNLVGVDVYWKLNEQAAFEQVKRGELDEGPIPAAEIPAVASRYGVNRARFWVKPECIDVIEFNLQAGLFKDNAPMRKAVNWAVDRTHYAAQAGSHAATPWTHLLLPGLPGSITKRSLQPYSLRPNLEKARAIAAGNYRDGNVVVRYWSSRPGDRERAEILRRDLTLLGLNVIIRPIHGIGHPPSHADLLVSSGWCFDSPDPSAALTPLMSKWLPDSATYSARVRAADRLTGSARLEALGKIDLQITKNLAPVAVMHTNNSRRFFSERVDPRSLRFHLAYSGWSIPAAALK